MLVFSLISCTKGMEMMGPSKRTFAGIVIEYFFALGQLILVVFAYTNYVLLGWSWRALATMLIIPCIPFLSYFFILPESPRWLLSKNRPDDAYKILEKVAKANKRTLNIESWNALLERESKTVEKVEETIIDIVKSPQLSILSVILFLNWIINNFVFYGVGLKSSDLGVNPYLSFALSAGVEFVSYILTHFILDILGRKLPYVSFLLSAGVSCLLIGLFDNQVIIVSLAMIGKFSASAAYAIIYLYSSELFPTSVRNTGMGACSMMARVGAMVAPKINDLSSISPNLPFLIYGISGLIGCVTAIVLPETLGRNLPETIKLANKVNKFG
jgi:OCT family organic cation transporter-like MFS transporter 4/5